MIRGLEVTIGADELATLCVNRAAHHETRAEELGRNIDSLVAAGLALDDGGTRLHSDPKRAVRERQDHHRREAAALRFIASHLKPGEEYQLSGIDLIRIGIGA